MKTINAAMRTHLDGTVTSLASIWRLIRRDGQEFYFTDHDISLTFDDGDGSVEYLPENGYDRSAIVSSVGLNVDNIDIVGLFATNQITESEINAGLFDYAEVRVSLVNHKDLTQGNIKMRRGRLGEVIATNHGTFKAELRGMVQNLSMSIVENYAPECRVDLGDSKCGIPIRPNVLGRNEAVNLGDFYRVLTLGTTAITYPGLFLNPSFERGTTGDGQVPTDWIATGVWDVETGIVSGLSAYDGDNFLRGGSASGTLVQSQTLDQLGITDSQVDTGGLDLDFSIRRANTDVDDAGQVVVDFLDAAGGVISTAYDTTSEVITPLDTWVLRSITGVAVPVLTRSIRATLSHTLITGIQSDSCFDDIKINIINTVSVNNFQEVYENRVYEVTVAGTTDGVQPAYDTVIDNTTVDGTATLTARDSFTRDGHIVDVIDATSLIISVDDARAVDDWFNGGVIVFDAGTNTSIALEIRDWTQSSGSLVTFMEIPFSPIPGTPIHIYTGCDKRIDVCFARFNNVLNFRGEPYVPDSDEKVKSGSN